MAASLPKHTLSKSTFIRGCQCHKSLYLYKHHYDLRDEIPEQQQAVFSRGANVGELARQLFPQGVDASPPDPFHYQRSVQDTKDMIERGEKVIYEAAFQFDRVMAAMDILVKKHDKWRAYEVKSSTSVSDTHILDASLQYYVIRNAEIELDDISIIHINNQYIRQGELDIRQLFVIESILEDVMPLQEFIKSKIAELKGVIKLPAIPEIDIGAHCSDPYRCDFHGQCWQHIPEKSVFNLTYARGKDWDLYQKRILSLEDVPDDYPLNDKQWMQVNCCKTGEVHIDKEAIKQFLNTVTYPLYFLDFETIMPAVPLFDCSKPYQQITFQYSLHYMTGKDAVLEHYEFLAEIDGSDPRIALIEQLIDETKRPGDIWVYNIGFERARLTEIARDHPKYSTSALLIADRLKDLMVPFQKRCYYTPEMDGSYSIKKVLPALVPELSYEDLEIQEGGTASNTFASMVEGTFEGDIKKTREDLLKYCELDTFGMVKILEKLHKLI